VVTTHFYWVIVYFLLGFFFFYSAHSLAFAAFDEEPTKMARTRRRIQPFQSKPIPPKKFKANTKPTSPKKVTVKTARAKTTMAEMT
jgi:hypothetical protein